MKKTILNLKEKMLKGKNKNKKIKIKVPNKNRESLVLSELEELETENKYSPEKKTKK